MSVEIIVLLTSAHFSRLQCYTASTYSLLQTELYQIRGKEALYSQFLFLVLLTPVTEKTPKGMKRMYLICSQVYMGVF